MTFTAFCSVASAVMSLASLIVVAYHYGRVSEKSDQNAVGLARHDLRIDGVDIRLNRHAQAIGRLQAKVGEASDQL